MVIQAARVNDEHPIVGVEKEDDLNEAPCRRLPTHPPFAIAKGLGEGCRGVVNDVFRLFRRHAVETNMVHVPVDPSKVITHDCIVADSIFLREFEPMSFG
jgi:hypothetical protein